MANPNVKPPRSPSTGLGYLLRTTHASFARLFVIQLTESGIPPKHYEYLRALLEEDGISQMVLSERVGMTRATVTGVLDTMERDGLVKRRGDPDDRRIFRVYLTAKGRNMRGAMLQTIDAFQAVARAGISDREIAQFRNVAEKMRRNVLEAARAELET